MALPLAEAIDTTTAGMTTNTYEKQEERVQWKARAGEIYSSG